LAFYLKYLAKKRVTALFLANGGGILPKVIPSATSFLTFFAKRFLLHFFSLLFGGD